jgi:hypothetical protein
MSRNALLLLLVCIALGGYVYKYEILEAEKAQKAEAQAKLVFQFGEAPITGVTIIRNDSTIELVQREEDWYLRRPLYHRANSVTVSTLTSSISFAETESVVDEAPDNYATFGLDHPAVTLIATVETEADTIQLGAENATGNYVYAKRPGAPEVFLTSKGMLTNSGKSIVEFRDKKALVLGENDVERTDHITIEGRQTAIAIERSIDTGNWMLTQPVEDRADNDAVRALIQQMADADVQQWLSDERSQNLASFGLDKPRRSIHIQYGVANHIIQHTVLIGDRVRGADATNANSVQYYGKDVSRDAVFVIDSSAVGNLLPGLLDLRNRTIVEFERPDINRIQLDYGDNAILCAQDSAFMWQIAAPERRLGKDWKISGILSDLEALEAVDFISDTDKLAQYGLENPRIQVMLLNYDEPVLAVAFGRTKGNATYCLNRRTNRVYLVQNSDVEQFQLTMDDLTETPPEPTEGSTGE